MLLDEGHNSRMSTLAELLESVRFNDDGLVPVIAQQWDSHEVLMMAWMDLPALERTLATGQATYFSRSRGEQWVKGATSGHCAGSTLALGCSDSASVTVNSFHWPSASRCTV